MALIRPDGTAVLSPSDLTAAGRCELGWLRGIDVRLGRAEALVAEDPLLQRIAALGDAHEARELTRLRAAHQVVEIPRPAPYTAEGLQEAAARTHQALLDGAEVVSQGVLYDGEFGGMVDFLVRDADGRYQVWDAKLARHVRVPALLQIAAYADQLDRLGVPRAADGHLLLGDRTRSVEPLDEVIPVYRRRRAYLRALLARHLDQPVAAAWGDDRYTICGDCPVCDDGIASSDDLLLVAGLSRSQRATLRAAGVATMTDLAGSSRTVDGLTERTWRKLRDQAAMQTGSPDAVTYEVFDAELLHLLPDPDPGDIFFDFEGDPMWTGSDGVATGLEYLFGLVELEQSADGLTDIFKSFWAHDEAAERQALIDFLDHVARRRAQHPGLHIYHYAPYEPTALKRLTVRHAVGEDQLDDLLRNGVFVDLYAAVRRSVRVSAPSYSIKKLEPLYMGQELRDEDGITSAGDSILQYHDFIAAREAGDEARAARLLKQIADYNEYDCVSTWRLRDWLLRHRPARALATVEQEPAASTVTKLDELQAVADRLLKRVPLLRADRDAEEQGVALLAAALGYFRREAKPMWWSYFARGTTPVDEWLDARGTLVADRVEVLEDWAKATQRARTLTRRLRLVGDLDPGTSLAPGTGYCLVYEDAPPGTELDPGAHRAIRKAREILSVELDAAGSGVVELTESTTTGQAPFDELPMAVFAHQHIGSDSLESAVQALVDDTLDVGRLPECPAGDVLARRAPRLSAGVFDASAAGDSVTVERLEQTVRALDASYLAVQGPPGSGKTYLGSHLVARLVTSGWKVAVVAQSHATVEQFLEKVIDAGVPAAQVAKKPQSGDTGDHPWTALQNTAQTIDFLDTAEGRVVGGTAWSLAPLPQDSFDLLVVDEAGQFSLAHTVAASRPARRLLLLGDPQQLPQVSQGSHPEPVDSSALSWLANGHDTMPADRGYFLARSRRMHSALTAPVSQLAYEGRLRSEVSVTDARLLGGVTPGLHPHPVPHTGNGVLSPEEAAAVVELVRGLVGTTWQPGGDEDARQLQAADVIVVAAYNAQASMIRRALQSAGYDAATVGTVDKLQGQEAAVSIVSLAASSAADIPRGLEFLLDRRRLNVAISRGQWASFLVHSPALADTLPASIPAVRQLGSFLRLIDGP